MKEEIKYCRECGSELQTLTGKKFDQYTGERFTYKSCVNLKCEDGCGNITNHNNWSCWRNKCLDCSYSVQDY